MDELKKKYLQTEDEKNFGNFLCGGKLGDNWAPTIHDAWPTYRNIAGVSKERIDKDSSGLQKGFERYWFETIFPNLYLTEIWANGRMTAVSFRFYQFDEEDL